MTKKEVLQDIDKLCSEIDTASDTFVESVLKKDFAAINTAKNEVVRLLMSAHQELSFLKGYIDENVVEKNTNYVNTAIHQGRVDITNTGKTALSAKDYIKQLKNKEK